jgi:hypothetical protein
MDAILPNISITINEKLYVKNPETSTLGKKIIESIYLLMKLALRILPSKNWEIE